MRKINLPLSTRISVPVPLPGEKAVSIHVDPHYKLVETARENAKTVIFATTQIEHDIEGLILLYIFNGECGKNRSFFENEILKTNFFTFSAKKRVVLSLIKNLELLEGQSYSFLEQSLKKIMNYRNAFAHGEFTSSDTEGVILEYFSGEQKKDVLSDEYWKSVEETFKNGKELLGIARSNLDRRILEEIRACQ